MAPVAMQLSVAAVTAATLLRSLAQYCDCEVYRHSCRLSHSFYARLPCWKFWSRFITASVSSHLLLRRRTGHLLPKELVKACQNWSNCMLYSPHLHLRRQTGHLPPTELQPAYHLVMDGHLHTCKQAASRNSSTHVHNHRTCGI
jgi:hypothetical protein